MSHDISTTGDTAHFATAREHAWHRLGQVLPDAMTAEQALDAAHLAGWNVRKVPEFAHIPAELDIAGVTEPQQIATGKFSTIRTNPITGDTEWLGGGLGKQYTPVQNEEHAELLNTLVDESGAHFETAGALGNGATVFLSMKLPQHIDIRGHNGTDHTDLYLVAANSHDGTSAFRVMVTPVRVVCQNTLSAALHSNKASYSLRHTSGIGKNLQVVREALGMTFRWVEEFERQAQFMADRDLPDSAVDNLLRDIFGDMSNRDGRSRPQQETRRAEVKNLWTSADTNAPLRGTAYGLYNAVVEYVDHLAPVQGKNKEQARALRTANGGNAKIKQIAFAKTLAAIA